MAASAPSSPARYQHRTLVGNWFEERFEPEEQTRHAGLEPFTRSNPKTFATRALVAHDAADTQHLQISHAHESYVPYEAGGLRAPRVVRSSQGDVRVEGQRSPKRSMLAAVSALKSETGFEYRGGRSIYNEQREQPWGVLPARGSRSMPMRAASEPAPFGYLEPSRPAGVPTRVPDVSGRNIITNEAVIDGSDYARPRGKRRTGHSPPAAQGARSLPPLVSEPVAGSPASGYRRREVFQTSVSPSVQWRKNAVTTWMDWDE
eukprot:a339512_145.p2 GENE.a339512_145~~a339512_145.p2  ORF type:complete len:271 (+),score=36.85 a339512_145:33-815(+)